MKIDAHIHFYPKFAAEQPESWAAQVGEKYWEMLIGERPDAKLSLQGFPSEMKMLSDMDEAGVDFAVIQGWYWEKSSTCNLMNEEIAKIVNRHTDRLSAFAAVQPSDTTAAKKIAARARDAGFIGLGEIHQGVQKFDFLSNEFGEFAQICVEENLPVCVHITESSSRQYMGKVATDNAAALAAAKKYPHLKFIFAHLFGGEILETNSAEKFALHNAIFDTAALPLQFKGDKSVWARATEKFPKKIAFGSDYPIRLYPHLHKKEELKTIVDEACAGVQHEATRGFFGENLRGFFRQ